MPSPTNASSLRKSPPKYHASLMGSGDVKKSGSDDSQIGSSSTPPAALRPLHHWSTDGEDDSDLVFPRGRYYDEQGMTLKTPASSAFAPTMFTASWSWLDSLPVYHPPAAEAEGQAQNTTPSAPHQTNRVAGNATHGRPLRQSSTLSFMESISSSGIVSDTSSTTSTLSGILGHLEPRKPARTKNKVSAYSSPTQQELLSRFFSAPVGSKKESNSPLPQPKIDTKGHHGPRGNQSTTSNTAGTHSSKNITNGLRHVGALLDTGEEEIPTTTCTTSRGILNQGVANHHQVWTSPVGAVLVIPTWTMRNQSKTQHQYAQLTIPTQPGVRRTMRRGRHNVNGGDWEESTNNVELGVCRFPNPSRTESCSQSSIYTCSSLSGAGAGEEAFPGWTWMDEEETIPGKGRRCRRVVGILVALVVLAVVVSASTLVVLTQLQSKPQQVSTTSNATTLIPNTPSPTTFSPSTERPTTSAPATLSPSTAGPIATASPTKLSPITLSPSTAGPITASPTTSSPSSATASPTAMTSSPTFSPTTASPSTGTSSMALSLTIDLQRLAGNNTSTNGTRT